MDHVTVYMAQETTGPIEPVRIDIGPDPIGDTYPGTVGEMFTGQARIVVDALYQALPGGTLDHVLAELLIRQARRFVRHPDVAG
jgi:hypothetical protein